jgi:hypothetical protein
MVDGQATESDWIMLQSALIWVLTRDPLLTYRVEDGTDWAIRQLHNSEFVSAAWLKLRSAIKEGRIIARGRKHAHSIDAQIDDVSELVISHEVGFGLVSPTYPLTPYTPWVRIVVSKAGLLEAFPASDATDKSDLVRHGKGRKTASVVQSLDSLAAENGGHLPAQWSAADRWDAVDSWLLKHDYELPSPTTRAEGYRLFQERTKKN